MAGRHWSDSPPAFFAFLLFVLLLLEIFPEPRSEVAMQNSPCRILAERRLNETNPDLVDLTRACEAEHKPWYLN